MGSRGSEPGLSFPQAPGNGTGWPGQSIQALPPVSSQRQIMRVVQRTPTPLWVQACICHLSAAFVTTSERKGRGNSYDCLSCSLHSNKANFSPDIKLQSEVLGWSGLCICPALNAGGKPDKRVRGLASPTPKQTEQLSQTGPPDTATSTACIPLGPSALTQTPPTPISITSCQTRTEPLATHLPFRSQPCPHLF